MKYFEYDANPDALWQDIQKLDDMYEELLWHPDDELQFSHDGEKIIITNKTLEKKMNEKAERINGWAAMIGVIAAMGSYATTGQIIPGVW